MTQNDFANHLQKMHVEEHRMREAGQKEYAHEVSNAFRNFETLAEELDIPREIILWVYLKKHMDGILAYLRGHKSQRESVHGRIKDARLYLALLDGMIAEDEAEAAQQ